MVGSTKKPVAPDFEMLWFCVYVASTSKDVCMPVCETWTGMKPRLQIENILNTHLNIFTLNQCQTTCAQHVNKLSDLFESPTCKHRQAGLEIGCAGLDEPQGLL